MDQIYLTQAGLRIEQSESDHDDVKIVGSNTKTIHCAKPPFQGDQALSDLAALAW